MNSRCVLEPLKSALAQIAVYPAKPGTWLHAKLRLHIAQLQRATGSPWRLTLGQAFSAMSNRFCCDHSSRSCATLARPQNDHSNTRISTVLHYMHIYKYSICRGKWGNLKLNTRRQSARPLVVRDASIDFDRHVVRDALFEAADLEAEWVARYVLRLAVTVGASGATSCMSTPAHAVAGDEPCICKVSRWRPADSESFVGWLSAQVIHKTGSY